MMRGRKGRVATVRSSQEYMSKVNLKQAKRIWRTIAVRGDQTLEDLHEAIFAAFDRDDEHLYSFYFPKAPSRTSVPKREYTAPFMMEDLGPLDDGRKRDAAKTRVDDLAIVEEIRPIVAGAQRPAVLERKGKSPPQYPSEDDP